VLEAENLKTQLIAERRNALLSARRESRLLEATEDLSTAVKNLTEAQGTLLSAATAKAEGRVCLHEQYVGTVSELIGSQVVVVYESKEGNPIKQFYDRDQFVEDYAPLEGETLYAFVFIAAATSRPSLQEPGSMEAEDFSGFRTSSVEGDIEL
jgi:hypothetical protein